MSTLNWGIISTAKIGVEQVIPAIQQADNCYVQAIASRTASKAKEAANLLDIPQWHDSYEHMLADEDIDIVYNPLPNHLHLPYTVKALEASNHVLCEKPIAMDLSEAQELRKAAGDHPDLKVMEAFMYRFHPQWIRAKELIEEGAIGELTTVQSFFSYYNEDGDDIRNKADMGGGGMMDIGCYCISLSRFLFDSEPTNVEGKWKIDPRFDTDHLASGLLDFERGTATFTCATQTAPHQQVNIVGRSGRIVIEIPFNAPVNSETHIQLYHNNNQKTITFQPVNQYTLQAEAFANAIINDKPVPTSLDDAVANMKALDMFRASAKS
jgi:predicted dehydrogenase